MIVRLLAIALLTTTAPLAAWAQPKPPQPGPHVAEIIVTGERVPRALRETPSSVVVATAHDIDAAATDRLESLLEFVPNVQFGSQGEGPAIRGQDSTGVLRELFAFLGGSRPRVTLQVDGRAVSYYEYVFGSAAAWDVERMEVFRSPQTTTQGRNSIAGAIFVSTEDPTYEWEGRGRAIIGDFDTRQASAMVSGPLVADQLAVRMAGDVKFGRMASDMADGIPGADIDRDDFGILRVKLLLEPKALPGARLETSYVHTQSQTPQFEAVREPFEKRQFLTPERTNGIWRSNIDSLTARLDLSLARALSSALILSYGDALNRRFGLPGLGRTRVDSEDFSAEANVNWDPDGPLSLLVGVHHLTNRQKQFIDITGLGIGEGGFRDRQGSFGLFGEGTWRPAARLAITGGLRYQYDSQDRKGQVGSTATGIGLDYDESFDALLPKLSIAYDVNGAVTAGLLIQRAYNPGGTSISLLRRAEDRFEAETLWNYEAFVRAGMAGGRGRLAANFFYNDISKSQRQLSVPILLPDGTTFFAVEFANAPSAASFGAEIELAWRFGDVSLQGGIGLLETEVRETIVPNDPSLGKDFQRSPGFSGAGSIDWRATDRLRLSAQIRHHSGYFSDDASTAARAIDATTIVNARAAYTIGPATLFGYVRNVFDEFYLTYLFTPTFGTAGDPREFGVGIEARF